MAGLNSGHVYIYTWTPRDLNQKSHRKKFEVCPETKRLLRGSIQSVLHPFTIYLEDFPSLAARYRGLVQSVQLAFPSTSST